MISDSFVAKTNRAGQWLPLSRHLEDTGGVMRHLCIRYVAPSVIKAAGLEADEFRSTALFCALVHDIGKATPAFQGKICDGNRELAALVRKNGFSLKKDDPKSRISPHALAGATILNRFCNVDESICEIIASHHGRPRDKTKDAKFCYQIKTYADNYFQEKDKERYQSAWKEIYENAAVHSAIDGFPGIGKRITLQAQMLLSGLLIMADWIASNETYFPLYPLGQTECDDNRVCSGLEKLALQPSWIPERSSIDEKVFCSRFGFSPNAMQKEAIRITNGITVPGIMIIEAPMGTGKTEAALSVAEVESYNAGTGGIYFGLPTQGTANGMFQRIANWAGQVSEDMAASISLAHGEARYNRLYMDFKTNVTDEDGLSVNSWMAGRHRALLPDFVTGTIDQLLMAGLKKKFVMLYHLGMSGKTAIIDEVHSYDAYMTEYMDTVLAWLGAYHVPVILLSATLTREKRNDFIQAYTGRKEEEVRIESDAYPLISWSDGEKVDCRKIRSGEIKGLEVRLKYASEDEVSSLLTERLSDGGCAGIIVDTVGGAQLLAENLIVTLPPEYTVVLLHSRFLPADRTALENKVLELVGKGSTYRNKIVVIGTQVLEQSLDLDFDVIFTEKCPIDLLFQRIGRLHRHGQHQRPEKLREPACYIFNDETAQKHAEAVYTDAKYLLRRTDEILKDIPSLLLPDNIREMTEAAYNLASGEDGKDKCDYEKKIEELKNNAGTYRIAPPEDCSFHGMLKNPDGQSSVRYGINSLDVVLVKRSEHSLKTFSGREIPKDFVPGYDDAAEILKQRISLRYTDDLMEAVKSFDPEIAEWKQNPALRECGFIITDENGKVTIGSRDYRYSKLYGWRKEP